MVYCTRNDVAAFLQVDDFSGTTTPADGDVDSFISMAMSRVEELTGHAWATARAREVTEERVRVQRVSSNVVNLRGRIQLEHYPILAFSQHATPSFANTNGSIQIWTGGSYVDFLDSDNGKTLGSSVTDTGKNLFVDTERGIIYIDNYSTFNMVNSSPQGVDAYVSYKYATANTPEDIKLATIYFTASIIVANDDLNVSQTTEGSMDNRTKSEKYEEMGMKILTDHSRIGRTMPMARAIGGFGTGMVNP